MSTEAIGFAGGGCCCLVCVVFLIVFFATSIKTIEQTDWCLKYSWWSQSVSGDPIVEPGMTFIGMGNYLVKYPNTNVYVYFRNIGGNSEGDIYQRPVEVRTKDGLAVALSMDLVYRLQPQNLYKLYMLVGEGTEEVPGWHTTLVHVAEGIIDNLATQYTAQAFYTNRTQVAKAFEDELRKVLSESLYIDLEQLQMHGSTFPDLYDAKIQETQRQQAEVAGALQQRQKEIIDKQGELRQEVELAQKAIATAIGDAQQITVDNDARVSQYLYQTEKEATGYQRSLGFFQTNDAGTGLDSFLKYMQVKAFQEHSPNAMTVKVR